jgi:hypothetical protein
MAKMNFKAMGSSHVISKESSETLIGLGHFGLRCLAGDNIPEGSSLL